MFKGQYARRDRLVQGKRHDVYRMRRKWPYPTICTQCNALFENGRWTWNDHPESCHKTTCPACQRISDNYPAGEVEIRGRFFADHQEELLNLIKNKEKLEKNQHPMERIMSIWDDTECVRIKTTGIHLARQIGEALSHSFQGDLHFTYGDAEASILVSWER